MSQAILAVIPARAGSKSIVEKNIVALEGLPLIAYTMDALNGAKSEVDHLVSTENEEIKAVAERLGGNVPFLRPDELARDDSNIVDVLIDVLNKVKKKYEYLMLLQPTAPLRASEDIDNVVDIAREMRPQSVCSFMRVESYHPWYMYYKKGNQVEQVVTTEPGKPRQQFPEALWRNGAIYLVKTDVLVEERKFITEDCIPYIMPPERSVNIDSVEDLKLAEYYLRESRIMNKESRISTRTRSEGSH